MRGTRSYPSLEIAYLLVHEPLTRSKKPQVCDFVQPQDSCPAQLKKVGERDRETNALVRKSMEWSIKAASIIVEFYATDLETEV
jgi:hypothetical protein